MSTKDGERLPHRRISTGSDLMKCGDRMIQKGFNGFIKIVKERIEGGANEKAVLRLFINCPFVCINFDFFWLNKARQLYMDF